MNFLDTLFGKIAHVMAAIAVAIGLSAQPVMPTTLTKADVPPIERVSVTNPLNDVPVASPPKPTVPATKTPRPTAVPGQPPRHVEPNAPPPSLVVADVPPKQPVVVPQTESRSAASIVAVQSTENTSQIDQAQALEAARQQALCQEELTVAKQSYNDSIAALTQQIQDAKTSREADYERQLATLDQQLEISGLIMSGQRLTEENQLKDERDALIQSDAAAFAQKISHLATQYYSAKLAVQEKCPNIEG